MTQRHFLQSDVSMLVTTVTRCRRPFFAHDCYASMAVEMLYRVQERHPFFPYAFVIMPDHVHLLLRVTAPNTVQNVMRVYKYGLSFEIGRGPLWQRRFHIRLPDNLVTAREYIHANPVVAGLRDVSFDYPWSSACGKWDVSDLPEE